MQIRLFNHFWKNTLLVFLQYLKNYLIDLFQILWAQTKLFFAYVSKISQKSAGWFSYSVETKLKIEGHNDP